MKHSTETEQHTCPTCRGPALNWARDQIEAVMGKMFYMTFVDHVSPEGPSTFTCRCPACGREEIVWRTFRISHECLAEHYDPLRCENCLETNRVSPSVELAWPPWSAEARMEQTRKARESFDRSKKFLELKAVYAEAIVRHAQEEKEARANALAHAKRQEPEEAEHLKSQLQLAIKAQASCANKKTAVSMAQAHVFKYPKKQKQLFGWICEGKKLLERLAA